MKFAAPSVSILVFAFSCTARASCAHVEPARVQIEVTSCEKVDAAAVTKDSPSDRTGYEGHVVKGSVTFAAASKKRKKQKTLTAFVDVKEAKNCKALGLKIMATLNQACCDGDPNPPCLLGTSEYLTRIEAKQ